MDISLLVKTALSCLGTPLRNPSSTVKRELFNPKVEPSFGQRFPPAVIKETGKANAAGIGANSHETGKTVADTHKLAEKVWKNQGGRFIGPTNAYLWVAGVSSGVLRRNLIDPGLQALAGTVPRPKRDQRVRSRANLHPRTPQRARNYHDWTLLLCRL
jgi:hypothetical protein